MTEPTLRFLDVEATIARLALNPGDRIVLMPAKPLTQEQLGIIRHEMGRFVPNVSVLVVPPGMRIAVLQCDQRAEVKVEATWTKPDVCACSICGKPLNNLTPGFGVFQIAGKEQTACLPCGRASGGTELARAR